MEKVSVTLISGRTANQGIGLEEGKLSERYINSVNYVQLCPIDAERMNLKPEDHVKIITNYGSVTVNWALDKGLDSRYVFFPYGPWANQVYAASTGSTGMPIMKGIPAIVEPSEEKVLTIDEIVAALKGGG